MKNDHRTMAMTIYNCLALVNCQPYCQGNNNLLSRAKSREQKGWYYQGYYTYMIDKCSIIVSIIINVIKSPNFKHEPHISE